MAELLRFSGAAREREPLPDSPAETLSMRSDEDLMSLVRIGSQAAFRVLVVRHADKVASFCARITGDRAAAREIAQDVWLALWDGRARWEPRARFVAFLYTIAFTRARNHSRSRRRRASVFAAQPLDVDVATSEAKDQIERLLECERRDRLWTAIADLPVPMREAIILRFVDELSYEEMESILHAKTSTLRVRVHHAIERLRLRLGKEVP